MTWSHRDGRRNEDQSAARRLCGCSPSPPAAVASARPDRHRRARQTRDSAHRRGSPARPGDGRRACAREPGGAGAGRDLGSVARRRDPRRRAHRCRHLDRRTSSSCARRAPCRRCRSRCTTRRRPRLAAASTCSAAATACTSSTGSSASRPALRRRSRRLPAPSSDQAGAAWGGAEYIVGGYTGTTWLNTIVRWRPGQPGSRRRPPARWRCATPPSPRSRAGS